MRYPLAPMFYRPYLLNDLSQKLIESHYHHNYGGALQRLNAITEKLESLDFDGTPGHVINGLKREELIALNSTLLHELYFASLSMAGKPTAIFADVLARDFGSVERWRSEFAAMGKALGGGSGWVLLVYMPRDRRLINQYAAEHSQAVAGGIPILALDMYEHAYHIDFGASAKMQSGAIRSACSNGRARCRNRIRSSCFACTASIWDARPRLPCARPGSTRST